VSGKFDHSDEEKISRIFSAWKTAKASAKDIPTADLKPTRLILEKDQSVQSSIRMGNRSIVRSHPDYVKAVFVGHVLGGYFGSRLMKNIREEKGLTYGIYASLHPLRHGSYLVIGADVNKENVNLTFDEIRKELKRLREETISGDELETARNHFIGSLQSEMTTPFAHADKLKTIYQFGLPADYYHRMILALEQITPAHVIETSANYFHEDKLFEIAVG
jgi:predicted Zn-dependent peptidase